MAKAPDADWPARKVTMRKVADLVPYARNARTHSEAQVAQIAASIREWGWTMPVLVDETDSIIAGHGRIMAAQTLGLDRVPTMTAKGWSEAQKRAYVIADNKLTLNAGWNEELLAGEFADLSELDFDLELTGFSQIELKSLMGDNQDGNEGGIHKSSLFDRFGAVPFSVLSARDGSWQDRKRAWLSLGIKSEEGRGAAPGGSRQPAIDPETGQIVRADSKGRPIRGAKTDKQANAMMKS